MDEANVLTMELRSVRRIVGRNASANAAKAFGKRLADMRLGARLKQREVAEKLEVEPESVSRWERGERSPNAETIGELATIYGEDPDELLRQGLTAAVPDQGSSP